MNKDYNEQIMGTIDFVISYDKDIIPDKDVDQLIEEISTTLNDKYRDIGINFRVSGVEDLYWFELNGLVQLAHNRRNSSLHPLHIIQAYLTDGELHRFSVLSRKISEEGIPR